MSLYVLYVALCIMFDVTEHTNKIDISVGYVLAALLPGRLASVYDFFMPHFFFEIYYGSLTISLESTF